MMTLSLPFSRLLLAFAAIFMGIFFQMRGTQTTFAVGFNNSATSLAFDAQGNLYVTDPGLNQVLKVTKEGVVSTFVYIELGYIVGLAFGVDGCLYVSNGLGSKILRVPPEGGSFTDFATVPDNPDLFGLAFDAQGNLYVTNTTTGSVLKISSAGVVDTTPFASGFERPLELAFDSLGNLYVSDESSDKVWKVTPGGDVSIFATGFDGPFGLAFDCSGNLYVANSRNNTVVLVSPDGMTKTPFVTSFLSSPYGLALDSSGNLYIANNQGNSVIQVTPNISITAPSDATIGSPINFVVEALYDNGNLATCYSGTLHFTSTDSLAVLPSDGQLSLGRGTFNAVFNATGCQMISAIDLMTSAITAVSGMIHVISPTVIGLCPNSGSRKGGTSVLVYGINFLSVKAVHFGSKRAPSFTINSDTSITVKTPRGNGTVPVTVLFEGGKTEGENYGYFSYTAPTPLDLCGRQKIKLIRCEEEAILENVLNWKAPRGDSKLKYKIYRDKELNQLVGTVRYNEPTFFVDRYKIKMGVRYEYFVVSIDKFGNVSTPVRVVIKSRY